MGLGSILFTVEHTLVNAAISVASGLFSLDIIPISAVSAVASRDPGVKTVSVRPLEQVVSVSHPFSRWWFSTVLAGLITAFGIF